MASAVPASAPGRALQRAALASAVIVFGLIVAGAFVTSFDAGLAVPDWPLAYGKLFPERWLAIRNIRVEHIHRLYAFTVGVMALGLALWAAVAEKRAFVRRVAAALPALVLAQGLIGAARILAFNKLWIPVLHGICGQLTFAAFVAFAVVSAPDEKIRAAEPRAGVKLRVPWLVFALLLGQLTLGAVMRHERWGLAIPGLPLLRGAWPDLSVAGAPLAFTHRLLGLALLAALALQARSLRASPAARPARAAALLAPLQILLGALTVATGRNPWLASFHTANGALLLVLQVALLLRLHGAGAGADS